MITLVVSPPDFDLDQIEVTGNEYRHLFRARRVAAGARVRIVDGRGNARWSKVEHVSRKRALLRPGAVAPANEPTYRLRLYVATPRSERASWLVEKATELGVTSICFIPTERTPRKVSTANLERWLRVATAAVEQCHRSRLPEISRIEPGQTWSSLLLEAGDRFYLDTGLQEPDDWEPPRTHGAVFIGPEGGWTREEVTELERLGCRPVSLGPRILRVETAAIAAATLLLLGRSSPDADVSNTSC